MKTLNTILSKVLVLRFYAEHIVPFLVVFCILFGFLSRAEHVAIASFLASQPVTTLIPIAIWTVYTARVISFNAGAIRKPENNFLYNLVFLPPNQRLLCLAQTIAMQVMPAILYGVFMITMAVTNGQFVVIALIITALTTLVATATGIVNHNLHNPNLEHRVSRLQRYLNTKFTRPLPLFFIDWVIRNQTMLVVWYKIVSCVLLFGVLKLYTTDTYDLRLLGLGIVFAFSIPIDIVYLHHNFNNRHFAIFRQLPLSHIRRVIYLLITLSILSLPETGLIIGAFPEGFTITDFVAVYTFALSIQFLLYNLHYVKDQDRKKTLQIVYVLVITWFVLILFNVPFGVLAAANAIVGIVLWKYLWYTFEYLADDTDKEKADNLSAGDITPTDHSE